ncbi:peptidoglycan-binding protein [Bacillus sp. FSL K6-0047]
MSHFRKLPKLVDLRGKTKKKGNYLNDGVAAKTDIAIHHSLTTEGSSASFANFHVNEHGWPGVAYHFVIRKNGTIEWNHNLGVRSYHVGNSNRIAVGICLVGDFRKQKPTEAQKQSLSVLVAALKKDLPNYKRTRGHNEFPGYAWKLCPEFDYRAVINGTKVSDPIPPTNTPDTYIIQEGDTFWSIANEIPGLSVDDLKKANPKVDPTKLKVGQKINLGTAITRPSGSNDNSNKRMLRLQSPMMRGDDVKQVQRAVGVSDDGLFGSKTKTAVIKYQKSRGLSADGIVGPATWAAIESNKKSVSNSKPASKPVKKYPLPTVTLKRGSKGTDVRQLQTALNAANFKVGKVDGDFGKLTEDAVRRFQKVYLPREVDGVAGPNTYRELDKVVN